MVVKEKKPEIRFKGYVDDWEEGELENEVDLYSGLTYSPTNVTEKGGTFVLRSSNVKNGEIVYGDNVFVKSNAVNSDNVREGDVIVVVRNGSRSLIGKHAQVKGRMDNTVIGAFMTGIHSKQSAFINVLLDTKQFNKEIEKNLGATINQITIGALKKMQFMFPDSDEQTSIGIYFKHLDELVALHRQKYDNLLKIKRSILENMFPKNGADVPELRFDGFTGAWEERNWEESVNISTNMVDPKLAEYDELLHIGPGNIESFTGIILDNVLKVKDSNLISGKFHFHKGDIIYGKINPQLGKYAIAPGEGLASADSYILNTKNGVVQTFLYSILQTKAFYNYSVSVSSRTGMPKINREELNIYNYMAPKVDEQLKIGELFVQLDSLTTHYKCELEKLKNIKKAGLEKMFV